MEGVQAGQGAGVLKKGAGTPLQAMILNMPILPKTNLLWN